MTSNNAQPERPASTWEPFKDHFFDRLDLELLLRSVRKRWVLVLVVLFMCLVAGTFYYIKQPKIFRAIATVEIDNKTTDILDVQEVYTLGTASWQDVFTYMDTQLNIIKSRYVMNMVVENLNLDGNMAFLGLDKLNPEELEEVLSTNKPDPVNILQQSVQVERLKDTNLFKIAYENNNPLLAQQISNMIASVFVEQNVERKLVSTRQALSWLSDQTIDLKNKLEDSERELYKFKKENDILSTSLEDRISITAEQLNSLSIKRAESRSNTIKLRALYKQVDKLKIGDIELNSIGLANIQQNEVISRIKIKLADLKDEYAQLKERYGPNHPEMKKINERLIAVQHNLQLEIMSVIESIKNEYRAAQSIEKGIASELNNIKEEALDVGNKELEYNRLLRERDTNQEIFNLVLKRLKETSVTSMLKNNNVRILDAAVMPKLPVKPHKMVILFAAFLLGLILSLGSAISLELLDTTLKNPEEIEKEIGLTMLGIVPTVKTEESGEIKFAADQYALANPRSSFAESVRSIRTNLIFMAKGQTRLKGRENVRLLITSPSPKEGKTTIATNLAIALSSAGQKVLVIDSDMRRPRLSSAFSIPRPDVGLSSLIVGEGTLEEAIIHSEHLNLDILPCGPIPPNPAELLGSKSFEDLLDELSLRYNTLIFDSPPVIAVTDAKVISHLMDGIVLVAKAGHTHKAILAQACKNLREVNAPLWGIVLNDLDPEHREYGYYYRYYYRYGYYYGEDGEQMKTKTKKKKRVKVKKTKSSEQV